MNDFSVFFRILSTDFFEDLCGNVHLFVWNGCDFGQNHIYTIFMDKPGRGLNKELVEQFPASGTQTIRIRNNPNQFRPLQISCQLVPPNVYSFGIFFMKDERTSICFKGGNLYIKIGVLNVHLQIGGQKNSSFDSFRTSRSAHPER